MPKVRIKLRSQRQIGERSFWPSLDAQLVSGWFRYPVFYGYERHRSREPSLLIGHLPADIGCTFAVDTDNRGDEAYTLEILFFQPQLLASAETSFYTTVIRNLKLSTPSCTLEDLALERREAANLLTDLRTSCGRLRGLLVSPLRQEAKAEDQETAAQEATIAIRILGCHFRDALRDETKTALDVVHAVGDGAEEADPHHRFSTSLGAVPGVEWKPTPLARVSMVGLV